MRLIIFTLCFITMSTMNLFAQANHCLDFNGTSNSVTLASYAVSGEFTLSTWFRCNAVSNSSFEERILSFGPANRLEIGIQDFSNKLWIYDQASSTNLSFGNDLRDNNWHQVTYVKSGTENFLYLDGQLVGTYDAVPNFIYGANFRIGAWTGGSSTSTFFNGKVDETRIWSVAKTADEIAESLFCPITGDEENLLAYWSYDQGSAGGVNTLETILYDSSPNNNNATLSNNFQLLGNNSNWVASDNDQFFYLDPSLSQNGNELLANTTGLNYQWLDCNDNLSEIAGATSATFSPSASGSYALTVSNLSCTETSECLDFVLVSTKDVLKESDLMVYPNPTTEHIVIDTKVQEELNVVITDQLGKVHLTEKTTQQITTIDLQNLPKGLYYITIENIVRKFVKL